MECLYLIVTVDSCILVKVCILVWLHTILYVLLQIWDIVEQKPAQSIVICVWQQRKQKDVFGVFQFCGELGHTFMEFVTNSGDYCQAQHV